MGGDFIRNRRLELAFLNTRNKPLASFLSFFFVKMFTPNVLMKWGFRGVQSGLVNKGVVFFFLLDDLDYARFDNVSL